MMKEVLKTISEKPYLSRQAVSKECGIAEGLFEQVLVDLKRFGYLNETTHTNSNCNGSCSGFALASNCISQQNSDTTRKNINQQIHFWQITKKGLDFISIKKDLF